MRWKENYLIDFYQICYKLIYQLGFIDAQEGFLTILKINLFLAKTLQEIGFNFFFIKALKSFYKIWVRINKSKDPTAWFKLISLNIVQILFMY